MYFHPQTPKESTRGVFERDLAGSLQPLSDKSKSPLISREARRFQEQYFQSVSSQRLIIHFTKST